MRNATAVAPLNAHRALALGVLFAGVLAGCGPGDASAPPAPLQAATPALNAASPSGPDLPSNTTEIDFAVPSVGANAAGRHLADQKATATYSVINLAPGSVVGVPAINAGDQAAMTVENAAGVRSYFFNGQKVRDIGTLGGPSASVAGLNNAGQVAGWADVDGDTMHAFRWSWSGGMRDLGSLGGGNSFGHGINQSGQVAGYVETGGGPVDRFAFRWDEKRGMLDLGVLPGETTSLATAINDPGTVTGFTDNRAFAWTRAQGMFAIGYGIPQFINSAGQVAGYVESARLSAVLFVWTAATGFQEIGTLGGSQSLPFGMNASGQVVGMSDTADDLALHAFLWSRKTGMHDLGVLGGTFSSAQAINDSGQVVGQSSYRTGVDQSHAFLWSRDKGMRDLNSFIQAAPAGLELSAALALSPTGAIIADSNAGLVLLKPGASGTDAPVLGPIVAGVDPIPVGTPVTFSASFTDQNRGDRHRATWNWGGGCSSPRGSISEANGKGHVTGTRIWCTAGSYWISLKVTDSTGRNTTVARQVTVGVPAPRPVSLRQRALERKRTFRHLEGDQWAPPFPGPVRRQRSSDSVI